MSKTPKFRSYDQLQPITSRILALRILRETEMRNLPDVTEVQQLPGYSKAADQSKWFLVSPWYSIHILIGKISFDLSITGWCVSGLSKKGSHKIFFESEEDCILAALAA